jgi:hypothetical protein
MEWIGILVAGVGAFFLGRSWRPTKTQRSAPTRSGLSSASDRELMLSTFRRELANYLIRVDPDRFLRLYHKARTSEAAIEVGDKKHRDAQLTLITERYPLYQDFDLIGTREHVLYADAFNMYPLEDIEEHFLNLVRFHALQRAADEDWKFRARATSDQNLEHLQSYVPKIKGTRFRQRLIAAVSQFFAHQRGNGSNRVEGPIAYETDALAVYYVPHVAENRYGFHFKDTGEFGLYGSFYDDSRDKTYQSFYRSDRKFEAENYLDYLRIDEQI